MRPASDFPKILIISAQPYNESEQSRTLDSYFHSFPNENLVQIFSDARIPQKGHGPASARTAGKETPAGLRPAGRRV